MWLGGVWACILTFVWLRGKIHVGEWCCEVVGSCEVEQVAGCGFLLPRNLIKTSVCVCVCVSDVRHLQASITSDDKHQVDYIQLFISLVLSVFILFPYVGL